MAYYKININTIKTRLSKRSKQAQEKIKKKFKKAVSREFRVQTEEKGTRAWRFEALLRAKELVIF